MAGCGICGALLNCFLNFNGPKAQVTLKFWSGLGNFRINIPFRTMLPLALSFEFNVRGLAIPFRPALFVPLGI